MTESEGKGLTVPKFSSFKSAASVPKASKDSTDEASDKKPKRHKDRSEHRTSRHDRTDDRDRRSRHRSEYPSEHREHRSEHGLEHRSRHRSDQHSAHRSEARSEKRSGHDSDRRHRRRSRSPAQDKYALVKAEPAPKPVDVQQAAEQFIIDQRGDPLISRYHRNDRAKVPRYRRDGRGRIMGSDGYLSIHTDAMDEEFSIRRAGQGRSALKDRHLFSKVRHTKPKRIRVRNDDKAASDEEDFVPLRAPTKRSQIEGSPESEDEGLAYRSIEGKAKVHQYSDSELEYDSSGDKALDFDDDDPARKKSIELSRRVKERPDDIEAWLDLISHQDVLLRNSQGGSGEATKAEVRSFAEIKLSMYESALQAKSPDYEERLLLGTMLEGAKIWPVAKLDRRLEDVVQQHPASFVLWRARVDSKMANVATFQFQETKDMFLDRLQVLPSLRKYPAGPSPGASWGSDPKAQYEQAIYVFLRITRFMHDAGFRELAVSAWQATLELNLHRPQALHDASLEETMTLFKDFWESEVSRIGEDGALGWAHYAQSDGLLDAPDPLTYDTQNDTSRNAYKSWGATEHSRGLQARCPARSMDEGIEDDPYRVVIFSDIERLILCIPEAVMPTLRNQLIDAFLLFCHLPPADGTSEWTRAATNDAHVMGDLRVFENELLQKPATYDPDEDDAKRLPSFNHDAHQLRMSSDCLFASQSWFQYFAGWPTCRKDQDGPVHLSWAASVLRQVVKNSPFEPLAQYHLALERVNEPGTVKKRARTLLKQSPQNLQLYLAYALAEWTNGNNDVARQVLLSSTGLVKSPSTDLDSRLLFWTAWSWMELEDGDRSKAILCLCASTDDSATPGPETSATAHQLLNTQQTLSGNLGYSLSTSEVGAATLTAETLLLFEYLTVQGGSESASALQGNISAAMKRVWIVTQELSRRSVAGSAGHERLLQSAARLLYFHASRGPFRSAYLREQLAKCLEIFPRNTMFLSLFAWASSSFGIEDPAGDMLRDMALTAKNDCVSSRIFVIRHELHRGNAHSTRAAFEQALNSVVCRSNADIWRCYVRFSYSRKELRAKAKEVFFRGLGHCPWSKNLAMEAFTTLVDVMDEFELGSVFNTMQSKGLRIHVELDEFLERRAKAKATR